MLGLGPLELGIILVIVFIIFGAGKLPQLGDALGKGIRNFKRATEDPNTSGTIDVTPHSEKTLEDKKSQAETNG